jgi:hypothetical protein
MEATMRRALPIVLGLSMTACTTLTIPGSPAKLAAPPAPETPVVLGTAIISPGSVVPAVEDAVRTNPASAASIAGAAASAAPDQAGDIRAAAIRQAPAEAAAVTGATTVKRRPPPPARIQIMRHDQVTEIVDAAEFKDAVTHARFSHDGFTRLGTGIARTLASLGRSVLQLVEDLR